MHEWLNRIRRYLKNESDSKEENVSWVLKEGRKTYIFNYYPSQFFLHIEFIKTTKGGDQFTGTVEARIDPETDIVVLEEVFLSPEIRGQKYGLDITLKMLDALSELGFYHIIVPSEGRAFTFWTKLRGLKKGLYLDIRRIS